MGGANFTVHSAFLQGAANESKGLFTWREEDPSDRKIREGEETFR